MNITEKQVKRLFAIARGKIRCRYNQLEQGILNKINQELKTSYKCVKDIQADRYHEASNLLVSLPYLEGSENFELQNLEKAELINQISVLKKKVKEEEEINVNLKDYKSAVEDLTKVVFANKQLMSDIRKKTGYSSFYNDNYWIKDHDSYNGVPFICVLMLYLSGEKTLNDVFVNIIHKQTMVGTKVFGLSDSKEGKELKQALIDNGFEHCLPNSKETKQTHLYELEMGKVK